MQPNGKDNEQTLTEEIPHASAGEKKVIYAGMSLQPECGSSD